MNTLIDHDYHAWYIVYMGNVNPKDEQWLRKNFEKLVSNHPGEYVAVAKGNVSFGKTRVEAESKLPKETKDILPSTMQIPHPESLTCAL